MNCCCWCVNSFRKEFRRQVYRPSRNVHVLELGLFRAAYAWTAGFQARRPVTSFWLTGNATSPMTSHDVIRAEKRLIKVLPRIINVYYVCLIIPWILWRIKLMLSLDIHSPYRICVLCVLKFMYYYTVCYFTCIFYAVVRQISMLFIDNKDSVFGQNSFWG